jgi:FKBP-type peptidyl-prolyl cis-trans isomerase SlyD
MKIEKNKVISLAMTVTDSDGDVVDEATNDEPFLYLHGFGNLFPKLEESLEGKSVSEKLTLTVTPDDGYGERDEELMNILPLSQFEGVDELEVGMMFHAETDRGPMTLMVVDFDDEEVTVDGNHPLAGRTLTFVLEVIGIRDASEDEIEHGHPHYPGGCGSVH